MRSRRSIVADLLLVLFGVVALAFPPWITGVVESVAGATTAGSLSLPVSGEIIDSPVEDVKREIVRLSEQNRRLADGYRRLDEFRTLADRLSAPRGRYVPGVLVGGRREAGRVRMLLDIGKRDGVLPGAGVVIGYAVFGVVESSSENSSWVLRMDAPPAKIPAIIARSGAEGLVEASADSLLLSYVMVAGEDQKPNAMIHDLVLTSGRAGMFPRGAVIGRITGVGVSEDGLFHTIEVRPELYYLSGDVVVVWKAEAEGGEGGR